MTRAIIAVVLLLAAEMRAWEPAQLGVGQVQVTVPPTVLFQVVDVNAATTAGGPTRVSFDLAGLGPGQALRISVRADGDLTLAGGPAIPATNISWTTSNVLNGIGINGTLNKTTYTPVFESQVAAVSGRVDLTWTLSAPGAAVRAGVHQATLRWKFEAVTP